MTDPTPPHRRSPLEHDRDNDLTVAWMAGAENMRERMQGRIDALEATVKQGMTDYLAWERQSLDRIDAITAETGRMRKALEQLAAPCNCHPSFSERGLQDPACGAGDYGDIARGGLGLPPVCQFNTRFTAPAISKKDT